MLQEEIIIGDVRVPIIRDDGITYYPISYLMSKVLYKKTGQAGLQKEYSTYISKFKIDYGINSGGIQNVNCISEEGLIKALQNSKVGRLDVDQKKAMNILLEYLHLDVISEDDRFIKRVSSEVINKYNEYIRDCIEFVLEEDSNIVWQKCTKCGNYYPYHINFFDINPHAGKEYPLYTFCRDCKGWDKNRSRINIYYPNDELRVIYNKYGEDIYKLYKSHDVIEIYNHWVSTDSKTMPKMINNKEDKIQIIKHCYNNGMFSGNEEINANAVYKVCKFNVYDFMKEVYKELFNVEEIIDIQTVRQIFEKQNIVIDNIYDTNYSELIKQCSLRTYLKNYCDNDLLEFIMKFHDYKYPSYKFKGGYQRYWSKQQNRISSLKYFIEEDMKISLEKVPLYITLTALRSGSTTTMYTICKKYYSKLFDWVNEVYPDVFDEKDFDIHYVRNNFESIEEAEVHDVLTGSFKNVIYNPNNTDRTIKIDGKVPDWFIFTNRKCYIVEYFGLLVNRDTDNSRHNDYKERNEEKIRRYEKLDGYGKLYIYSEDLKDDFYGLREKLKLIV